MRNATEILKRRYIGKNIFRRFKIWLMLKWSKIIYKKG